MKAENLHPNTSTLLAAWARIETASANGASDAQGEAHADLLERLFVLERKSDEAWTFRNAGDHIARLLGRELAEHDYLALWTGYDRPMIKAFLSGLAETRQPGLIHARGETLTGKRMDLEILMAPLPGSKFNPAYPRLLGLYQPLESEMPLNGRPLWRHRLTAIFPPDTVVDEPPLRLVAVND